MPNPPLKPITDKAEISIDFPDKAYMGSFSHDSQYEAHVDETGVTIRVVHPGEERRAVGIHLHWFLFADILDEIADTLAERGPPDAVHGEPLREAAAKLAKVAARKPAAAKSAKPAKAKK